MALLKIIKISEGVWKHWSDKDGFFALTRLYAKVENNKFLIVEAYGAKRRTYAISEIEVYNVGGSAETFANFDDLQIRLKALNYIGYDPTYAGSSIDSTANHFKDDYNIITNTPTLADGTGSLGDEYRCTDAGTRDFGSGNITVGIDDILAHDGVAWFLKVNNNQGGNLTDSSFGTFANSLTTENAIADGDEFNFTDVSDTNKQKKTAWSNVKAVLKIYFDTLYQAILVSGTNIKTVNGNSLLGSGDLVLSSTPEYFKDQHVSKCTRFRKYQPDGGNTIQNLGLYALSSTGTLGFVNKDLGANGNLWALGATSSAAAGSASGFRDANATAPYSWAANFKYSATFMNCDAASVANAFCYVGFGGGTGSLLTSNPSSTANILFLGTDAGDTNLQIMHNDASGTATKIDLGANFPANTSLTDVYTIYFNWKVTTCDYYVIRHNTGHTASGTLTTNLPVSGAVINEKIGRCNGATALAVKIAYSQSTFETYV